MRECPVRLEIGSLSEALGKGVLKTWGDHAPAEIRTRAQGISETALVDVFRMRILDNSSLMSFPMDMARAG